MGTTRACLAFERFADPGCLLCRHHIGLACGLELDQRRGESVSSQPYGAPGHGRAALAATVLVRRVTMGSGQFPLDVFGRDVFSLARNIAGARNESIARFSGLAAALDLEHRRLVSGGIDFVASGSVGHRGASSGQPG